MFIRGDRDCGMAFSIWDAEANCTIKIKLEKFNKIGL
jgi:hypothetical protein